MGNFILPVDYIETYTVDLGEAEYYDPDPEPRQGKRCFW